MSAVSTDGALQRAQAEPRIAHGGDLGTARALFPDAPEPWLDLSTGINPLPYPLPPLDASVLRRLPSAGDLHALKTVAAAAYAAPGPDHVAAAPGTQILIETLPRLWPRGSVAVVGPTYAEHAAAWERAGHRVTGAPHLAAAADADVVVVVSPNNPDGRVWPVGELAALARDRAAAGGLVLTDRAFADLEPEAEPLEPHVGSSLAVLRSFGKTYGLAGLRLGFLVAEPALCRRIEAALGAWAVSGPAIAAGRAALPDDAWRALAARARGQDAARLDRMLQRGGGVLAGGTALFRTADFPDGPGLFRRLGEAGIYVRRFTERPERLRFGLPPDKAAWCRLSRVLKRS